MARLLCGSWRMRNVWMLRSVITIAALLAAVLHVRFPWVVPDAITAEFLLLAFVPWLAPLIKSVEVTGIGKLELREVEQT